MEIIVDKFFGDAQGNPVRKRGIVLRYVARTNQFVVTVAGQRFFVEPDQLIWLEKNCDHIPGDMVAIDGGCHG